MLRRNVMGVNEENFILKLKKRNEKALDYVIDNYLGFAQQTLDFL